MKKSAIGVLYLHFRWIFTIRIILIILSDLQRRSARNTTRKKYTEDYDFKITDEEDSSSSSDDNGGGGGEKKVKESTKVPKKKSSAGPPSQPRAKNVKVKPEIEGDSEVDVESVEPAVGMQGTQFFVVRTVQEMMMSWNFIPRTVSM